MSKKEIALQQALDQITSSFGKGSIMWLGRAVSPRNVPVISTGSFALDVALGVGGLPKVYISLLVILFFPQHVSMYLFEKSNNIGLPIVNRRGVLWRYMVLKHRERQHLLFMLLQRHKNKEVITCFFNSSAMFFTEPYCI